MYVVSHSPTENINRADNGTTYSTVFGVVNFPGLTTVT